MFRQGYGHLKSLIVGLVLASAVAGFCLGQTGAKTEYDIKAAYLYNFLRFVSWPAGAQTSDTVIIGILGNDPFKKVFVPVVGRPLRGGKQKLVIRKLGKYGASVSLRGCSLLFVSQSERAKWPHILAALRGKPVLTVSDQPGFLEAGGMINLQLFKGGVRWEINPAALKAAGLKPNVQLLRNAIRVLREETTEHSRSEE